MSNPAARVPAHMQIPHEERENYAKIVGRHSATHGFALENLFAHGGTRNTQRSHSSATFPPVPNAGQMQTQIRFAETLPSHNFHLRIIAFIESFR